MIEMINPHCCLHPHVVETNQYYTCASCGTVVSERFVVEENADIDELGTVTNKQYEIRDNITTAMTYTRLGTYTEKLHSNGDIDYRRLGLYNRSVRTTKERHYLYAYKELSGLSKRLEIPPAVCATAWNIYRRIHEKGLTRGRTMGGFVVASICVAARVMYYPLFIHEIEEHSNYRVSSSLKLLIRTGILKELGLNYRTLTISDSIRRAVAVMGLPFSFLKAGLVLSARLESIARFRPGLSPLGVAAALLYLISRRLEPNLTQEYISEALKITEATLRNVRDYIKPILAPILYEVITHYREDEGN